MGAVQVGSGHWRGARGRWPGAMAVALGLLAGAGCTSTALELADSDPRAEKALKEMADTLKAAPAVHFRVQTVVETTQPGARAAKIERESDIVAARPNRLLMTTVGNEGQWAASYNGRTLNLLDLDRYRCATEEMPGKVSELCDYMALKYGLLLPLSDLLVGDTYQAMPVRSRSPLYLGLHEVDGRKCHHVLCAEEKLAWQVWISAEKPAVPLKIQIDYRLEPGKPRCVATLTDWDLAPKVTDDTFTVLAPHATPGGPKSVPMAVLLGKDK